MHVHTFNSPDAFTRLDDLAGLCKRAGIDGLAITDHNRVAQELPAGVIAIHGIEVTSKMGHIIGLGVQEPIGRGMSPEETIDEIRAQGGIASLPHPYDIFRAGVRPESLTLLPDAVEVINGSSILARLTWPPAEKFANDRRLPRVAGSDSHIPETVGRAYTFVDAESDDEDSILKAIKIGRTSPVGKQIAVGMRVKKMLRQAKRSL